MRRYPLRYWCCARYLSGSHTNIWAETGVLKYWATGSDVYNESEISNQSNYQEWPFISPCGVFLRSDTMGGHDRECTACFIFDKVPAGNIVNLIDVASPNCVRLYFASKHFSSCVQIVNSSLIVHCIWLLTLILPCHVSSEGRRKLSSNVGLGSK